MLTEKIKILTGGLVMAFMLMLPAVSLSAQQTSIQEVSLSLTRMS